MVDINIGERPDNSGDVADEERVVVPVVAPSEGPTDEPFVPRNLGYVTLSEGGERPEIIPKGIGRHAERVAFGGAAEIKAALARAAGRHIPGKDVPSVGLDS